MNVVHCGQFDPAGAAWNLSKTFALHDLDIEMATVMVDTTLVAPDRTHALDEAGIEALRSADVQIVHCGIHSFRGRAEACEETLLEVDAHEEGSPFFPHLDKERVVLWLDGSTAIRSHVEQYRKRYAGYRIVATNSDIAVFYGAKWIPPCVSEDVDALCEFELPSMSSERLLVHPYTDEGLKGGEVVRRAINQSPGWRLQAISSKPHAEAIAAMRAATVIADHFQGYFGVVTLEATALGKPVILRLSDLTREAIGAYGWTVPASWICVPREEDAGAMLRTLSDFDGYMLAARSWWEAHGANRHRVPRFREWLNRS